LHVRYWHKTENVARAPTGPFMTPADVLSWFLLAQDRQFDRSQERSNRHEIDARFDGRRTDVLRGSSAAAEFAKTGSAEYDTYYVYDTVAKIDSGVGTGAITDFTGITRNVKGEGPFHDMSVRCLGHYTLVGETYHFNGSCVETDKDGDNVFTTFDDKNHYMIGGTGKYKGITGTVPYTVVELHETVGGRWAHIINHKATWEIK
jgi:hypothetical protein